MKLFILGTAALVLVVTGAGCDKKEEPQSSGQQTATSTPQVQPVVWMHPVHKFKFTIPGDTDALVQPDGTVFFVNSKTKVEQMRLVTQPGIPGIPLPPEKIEKVKVNGVAGHLYHDVDAADGGTVDKLIVDFPDGKNTVYIAAPELPGSKIMDLKAIAGSWKWK